VTGAGRPPTPGHAADENVTTDAWLGGKLSLLQPAKGYRVAIDAALLAAATPLAPGGHALELGAGVGAAALALAWRVQGAHVDGIELQPSLAALARRNAEANRLADRVEFIEADIRRLPKLAQPYDEALFNPPYLRPEANDASPDPIRRIATVEGPARLDDWMKAAVAAVRPGGGVTLIHRADRLADILAAAANAGLGGLTVWPVWPRRDADAHRIIVRGRAGKGGRLRLAAGLVLHRENGQFTEAAAALLEGAALEHLARA